jgi:molecular chaperone DnaJ
MLRDFYEVLGVEKNADADSIKKAYRKLAMQFHPDKNPGNKEAEEKFKEAATAYEVLSNPEKKSRYDRFGHAAFQGGAGGGGAGFQDVEDIFSSFGDIFEDFFGMGRRGGGGQKGQGRTGPRRGADLRYVTEISLKDVVSGIEKDIEFDTEKSCDTCQGSGAAKGSAPVTCTTCGGRGQVVRAQGFFSMASTCPACAGEGVTIKDPCKSCKGKGRQSQHRKIRVTIPPGVDSGTRLRVSGEGEGGYRGGPTGDLYVEIAVKDEGQFQRQGEHLIIEQNIDYLTLLLGGEIEVPTVTGSKSLQVPKGTQVGETLKIAGEGIPSLRSSSGRRGDLFVAVGIEIPKNIPGDEEKLLKEIKDLRGSSRDGSGKGWGWGKRK